MAILARLRYAWTSKVPMKILLALLCATLFVALPLSCKSTKSSAADVPCRCGTPMADLEECAHPLCAAGKNNPANPNCVCGKLDIPSGK